MGIELNNMTRKELLVLKTDVEKALVNADERDRRDALKAAEDAVAKFGFSLSEISGGKAAGKGKRSKAAAKYRNPADPEQTWSGLGRKPRWIHEVLSSGTDLVDLEI